MLNFHTMFYNYVHLGLPDKDSAIKELVVCCIFGFKTVEVGSFQGVKLTKWDIFYTISYQIKIQMCLRRFAFCVGKIQGGSGHWSVYYTSPQSFIITFHICWLNNFGDFYTT